jgi:cell division protein FtsL
MRYFETQGPEAPVLERRKKSKKSSNAFPQYMDQELESNYQQPREEAGKSKLELSTFNIVVLLVIAALVVAAYISNIITVDRMMLEVTKLDRVETRLFQQRENLRAEINMLSSYNRVQKIASEKLGLVHSKQQPYTLSIIDP